MFIALFDNVNSIKGKDMFENGIYQWRKSVGKQVSVAVSGDICPWKSAEPMILEGKSAEILKGIQPALDKADLRIAQWETVITDKLNPIVKAGPNLSVKPGVEAFLTAGKFDVALLANNHTGDHGPSEEVSTLNYLHAAGIKTVGAGFCEEDARKPLHLEKNGYAFSILNFCETEFGTSWEDHAGTNAMDEFANLLQIEEESKKYDIVIVIIHGGNEHNPIPSPRMKKLYRAFAKAGATMVMNIHTHCPQGIEVIDNVPIIYSPGNFFFSDMGELDLSNFWWSGYLPRVSFDAEGAYAVEITPFYFAPDPWRIVALEGGQRQWFLDYVDKISALMKTDGDHWFDVWCASRFTMPLGWVYTSPAEALAKDPNDADGLKRFPGLRHMLTCQAHNELSRRCFLLIERGKIDALKAEIPALTELRTARFAEQKI